MLRALPPPSPPVGTAALKVATTNVKKALFGFTEAAASETPGSADFRFNFGGDAASKASGVDAGAAAVSFTAFAGATDGSPDGTQTLDESETMMEDGAGEHVGGDPAIVRVVRRPELVVALPPAPSLPPPPTAPAAPNSTDDQVQARSLGQEHRASERVYEQPFGKRGSRTSTAAAPPQSAATQESFLLVGSQVALVSLSPPHPHPLPRARARPHPHLRPRPQVGVAPLPPHIGAAQRHLCGVIVEKKSGGPIYSGNTVSLRGLNGLCVDVESCAAAVRWSEPGEWQHFQMELVPTNAPPVASANPHPIRLNTSTGDLQPPPPAEQRRARPTGGVGDRVTGGVGAQARARAVATAANTPRRLLQHGDIVCLRAHTGCLLRRSEGTMAIGASQMVAIEASAASYAEAQRFEIIAA